MTQQEYFDEILKIEGYLKEKGIPAETFVYPNDFNMVDVNIEWGDWKHEHLACSWTMEELGYYQFNQVVTEEDGSDCYSAVHYYKKEAA